MATCGGHLFSACLLGLLLFRCALCDELSNETSVEEILQEVEEGTVLPVQALKNAIDKRDSDFLKALLAGLEAAEKTDAELFLCQKDLYRGKNYSLLHYACFMKERSEHVRVLLEGGFHLVRDLANQKDGIRPIHMASSNGQHEAVKVLLAAGVEVKAQTAMGMTAVTMAARGGHLKVLEEFKEAKGDALISLKERSGETPPWTPLQHAVHNGNLDIIKFFAFEVHWGEAGAKEVIAVAQAHVDAIESSDKPTSQKVAESMDAQELVEFVTELSDSDSADFKEHFKKYFLNKMDEEDAREERKKKDEDKKRLEAEIEALKAERNEKENGDGDKPEEIDEEEEALKAEL